MPPSASTDLATSTKESYCSGGKSESAAEEREGRPSRRCGDDTDDNDDDDDDDAFERRVWACGG